MSVFGKDATDSLYVLLCRYIRSQATHRYVGRSAASYDVCALRVTGGSVRDQKGRTATYIYINIYTMNLKFAQLVTELASLATRKRYSVGLAYPAARGNTL